MSRDALLRGQRVGVTVRNGVATLTGRLPGPVEAMRAFDSDRSISAIAPGPDGELYVTDLGGGELLRVVATSD